MPRWLVLAVLALATLPAIAAIALSLPHLIAALAGAPRDLASAARDLRIAAWAALPSALLGTFLGLLHIFVAFGWKLPGRGPHIALLRGKAARGEGATLPPGQRGAT